MSNKKATKTKATRTPPAIAYPRLIEFVQDHYAVQKKWHLTEIAEMLGITRQAITKQSIRRKK